MGRSGSESCGCSCLFVLLPLLLLFALGASLVLAVFLHGWRSVDPEAWDQGVLQLTGGQSTELVYLETGEEAQVASGVGLSLEQFRRASAVEKWIEEKTGDPNAGDRNSYLVLTRLESNNCGNAGQCFATEEYAKRAVLAGQKMCLAVLAEIWERNDIRSLNPIAAQYIPEDYNIDGIRGSCGGVDFGGGAIGCSQFLPCTALGPKTGSGRYDYKYLQIIGEPFDLLKEDTAMMLMALHLHDLGLRKNMDPISLFRVFMRWNADRGWVNKVVASVRMLWGTLGAPRGEAYPGVFQTDSWWKQLLATGLRAMGLYPEIRQGVVLLSGASGELIQVEKDGVVWQLPVVNPILSSTCQDHTRYPRNAACAWDLTVPLGSPVFPTRSGTVVISSCNNAGGYGCWVQVDHGDGYTSVYAHLQSPLPVTVGQEVETTTVIGTVGWTGETSFGPHVHFEVRKDGAQIDPVEVFGSYEALGIKYKKFGMAEPWQELSATVMYEVPSVTEIASEAGQEITLTTGRNITVVGKGPIELDPVVIDQFYDEAGVPEEIGVKPVFVEAAVLDRLVSPEYRGLVGAMLVNPASADDIPFRGTVEFWISKDLLNRVALRPEDDVNVVIAHELYRGVLAVRGDADWNSNNPESKVARLDNEIAARYQFVR